MLPTGEYLEPSAHFLAVTQVALSNLADGDVVEFRFGSTSTSNSAQPIECDGLEYAALPVILNPFAVWALSVPNNAGRFFFDVAGVRCRLANFRGELAVVAQDIGDTELQRCSDPTKN